MQAEWTPVESSQIAAMRHDPEQNEMDVQFKSGGVYRYLNVPEAVFVELTTAASVGRTFSQLIKAAPTKYPFERLS